MRAKIAPPLKVTAPNHPHRTGVQTAIASGHAARRVHRQGLNLYWETGERVPERDEAWERVPDDAVLLQPIVVSR